MLNFCSSWWCVAHFMYVIMKQAPPSKRCMFQPDPLSKILLRCVSKESLKSASCWCTIPFFLFCKAYKQWDIHCEKAFSAEQVFGNSLIRLIVEKEVNKRVLRQSNLKSSVNLTLLILFSIEACGVPRTKYFLVKQNPVLVIGLVALAPHRGRLPSSRPLSLRDSCLLPHVREGPTSV